MRQELQALNTIEVIDDKEESTEKFHPDKTEHSRSVQSVPDINTSSCTDVNYQTPSCSQFTFSFTSSDKSDSNVITSTSETIHNTECTSTSETIHNTECTSTSETHNTECTSTSETHNTECTGSDVTEKEILTTVSSDQELYDKSDKISRPSNGLPSETVLEKDKEQEIDDFEYLGSLDDGYLLSLFEEEEEDKIPSCTDVETISEVNNTVTVNQVVEQAGSSNTSTSGQKLNEFSTDELELTSLTLNDTTTSTSEVNNSRRYNPPRRAKDGVEYCENNDYLEEVLQSEYCMYMCLQLSKIPVIISISLNLLAVSLAVY